MPSKLQETAPITANRQLQGDYWQIDLHAPGIVPLTQPGQFVHMQLPNLGHRLLRRPFSIYNVNAETGILSVVYKIVGEGTRHMAQLLPPQSIDLLGPLGVGYSPPAPDRQPIVVAGGYGCAATYLYAKRSPKPCIMLLGGRTSADVLLVSEFRKLGCDVRISTDDGSEGHHGIVTDLLDQALASVPNPVVIACGPNAMLRTVARILEERGVEGEVSLDHVMCCGVGACFACVVKMKSDTPDGWEYVRTCMNGPVFKASSIYWDD